MMGTCRCAAVTRLRADVEVGLFRFPAITSVCAGKRVHEWRRPMKTQEQQRRAMAEPDANQRAADDGAPLPYPNIWQAAEKVEGCSKRLRCKEAKAEE